MTIRGILQVSRREPGRDELVEGHPCGRVKDELFTIDTVPVEDVEPV